MIPLDGLPVAAIALVLAGFLAVAVAGLLLQRRTIRRQEAALKVKRESPPAFVAPDDTLKTGELGALHTAVQRAETANRAKSDFLASMSHEIRTPLSGVIGMAQELDRRISDPEQRQFVETIRESGEHLLRIINNVLDLSKIEAGKLDLESVAFTPADLVEKAATLHAIRAEEKGLAFSCEIDEGSRLPRLGDPQRVLQILHNLVGNAIKFTSQGSVHIHMKGPFGQPLQLIVRDTGIGMTQEQLAQIFDGFCQADTSIARRFGGTGLGMSITKKLIDAMQGSKEIESTPGGGTTVTVTLPLAIAKQTAPAAKRVSVNSMVPRGLRILAVDDNATNRILIDLLLKQIKAKSTVVASGKAAVQMVAQHQFDVILMDIAMPEMDGIEALNAIREAERESERCPAPALAVTANAMTHQIDEYLACGFDGHVAKPIQIDHLFNEILRISEANMLPAAQTGTD
ncbi:MAG: ATP-binding protein [Pseudomonadota bacterium]